MKSAERPELLGGRFVSLPSEKISHISVSKQVYLIIYWTLSKTLYLNITDEVALLLRILCANICNFKQPI